MLAVLHKESAHEFDAASARMYGGMLSLRRGDIEQAVELLEDYDEAVMTKAENGMVATDLAEALARRGSFMAARQAIGRAFAVGEELGDSFFTPERYRVMGVVMTAAPPAEAWQAENWFLQALESARQQGSLGFALRAATDLARFYQANGRESEGHAVLTEIYHQFGEGLETPDLVAARALLGGLQGTLRAPARSAVAG